MSALVLVQDLLRHPALTAELVLLSFVLFGAGRAFGLPLLFWHERRGAQLLTGVSATVLVGELLLVMYVSRAGHPDEGLPKLSAYIAIGNVVWGGVVVAASLFRWVRGKTEGAGVTPRVRALADGRLGDLVGAHPPIWPFVLGYASGAVALTMLALLGDGLSASAMRNVARAAGVLMLLGFVKIPESTPAIEMCALLGLVTAAYGFSVDWFGDAGGAVLLIDAGALLVVAGRQPRRLQITALKNWYAQPVTYPPAQATAGNSRLLAFNAGWLPGNPRPLILICTSGGGIRAAAWTAAILSAFDRKCPSFHRAVRLVTGASGGMVGAAAWVARLHSGGTPANLVAAVAGDSLSAVAHRLVFRDIRLAFLPFVNDDNRGRALELAWNRYTDGALAVPLGALREKESRGELPSLVFSPMLVEDGRRLILSNLDLSLITTNLVRWVKETELDTASRSAFHIEDLLPGSLDRMPLYTAARLSASFPYVSPASALPTEPTRRVVDAGYYDNYGLSLACEWLREALMREKAWIEKHVSRILLLQIRDNVSELSVAAPPSAGLAAPRRHLLERLGVAAASGFEWLTSPVSGVFAARESVMLFRNDAALEAATELYDQQLGTGFLTTTIFEFKGEASLSWYLTKTEYDGICAQAGSTKIGDKIRDACEWLSA